MMTATGGIAMSVRKRKWITRKGEEREAWICQYIDQDGVDRITTHRTKKEAEAFQDTVRSNVRKGIHTTSKVTVAEAGKKWLVDAEDRLEPATVESYRQHLDDHIIPYIGPVKLSQLTVPLVREFMDELRANKRSPAMIKRVVGDLGSILTDAQERGLVAQNVVRSLNPHKKRTRRRAERRQKIKLKIGETIPSPEEIRVIVAHLKGRWRPLLLTTIFTGLRASELRGLKWSNIDLKKAQLTVSQRADRYNSIGQPKSESGQRTLPLAPIVVNTLREWKLSCPKGKMDLVFPNGAGGIENLSNILTRGLGPAQIAADVVTKNGKAKYAMHALRHFYASWCINRKADGGLELPPKLVQRRLGHSSIVMTMDVYGHLFPHGDDGAELAAAQKALLG
jgi:integrase